MIPIIFWMITSSENVPAEIHKDIEDQPWKGFSVFLHVLLPIAGLALLWGQRGIFSKLLLQLDRSCVSVYCPSLSKREKLLKWASDRLPSTWSSQARTLSSGIPELWKDGSLLCTLINSVVPGACPNPHRHWRKPPLHAQALAYKYLGLVPMFTDDELSGDFTMSQERNFIQYLHKLQEAINKWASNNELSRKFSTQYVARGMGLYTGEQHRKTVFYVYSNATAKRRSNVLMYIRGPYGTQGKVTISPFHNLKTIPVVNVLQDQLQATKTLPFKNEEQKSFLKTISLDFTSLINNIEDKGEKNEIPIQIDMEIDRAKITYIPKDSGIYEINLICDGELLRGSPYSVQVINNTSGKKDSFNTECENVEEKITFTKRKILSKVIDCIDEKICIDNNKISRIKTKDSTESSTESESDDLTITAITKKKDEILKTEINCTLEDIIEEINLVQDKDIQDQLQTEKQEDNQLYNQLNALEEIKKIAEQLKTEVPNIVDTNIIDEVDSGVKLKVDTKHKFVKDCEEASTEIFSSIQNEDDEVDNKFNYNVEKDVTLSEKNILSRLDIGFEKSTKYLKDIVNSTSKQEMLEKILPTELIYKKESNEDENHNLSTNVPLRRIKSKICVEINPRSMSKTNTSISCPDVTSPICPEHIAPEVEMSSLNQLTLSQKRQTLSKQDSFSIPDGDGTFSTSENDDSSKSKESTFKELSVLNVLNSLKQSRKNSLSETYSLSSTTSLPNMTSIDSGYDHIDEPTFKARKDYWERLSSRSSSSVSLANSDYNLKRKVVAVKNNLNKNDSIEKCFNNEIETTQEMDTSVENTSPTVSIPKEQSLDTSLEDCILIPLEERKKRLLKDMYERETRPKKKLNIRLNFFKKNNKPKVEEKETYFSSISDRIQNFDQNNSKAKPKGNSTPSDQNLNEEKEELKKSTKKHTIKSQFKRAINFFKNMEENSKLKEKNKTDLKRRYSLDFQKKSQRRVRGGSLNLPNTTDRFSISNLYQDVFGNKNGSFKGTPNNTGIANSLASLSKTFEPDESQKQEDNSISYNLFVNKSKNKKRKSIRSLFDVNY
ncbi:repetitive organellar protein-like isoform X2 [Zophobas morio]|uniref:repetitive organellar protein-like isoform X2 n=1 Tax=Zophobas morio TaxID=2755281 RepID=UPI0030838C24